MATADAPTPVPGRASRADRQRVMRLLERRSDEGSISLSTFVARVDRALTARSRAELDDLVADVRTPGRVRGALLGAVAWAGRLTAELEAAWDAARLPVLALPEEAGGLTVGRLEQCDQVVDEPSVSRRHAELRRDGERWLLRDLGSRNGTRVNGVRVSGEVEVRPGDQISLGGVRRRIARRR